MHLSCLSVLQVDELRKSHPTELFYFRPATKETEVEEDDCEPPDYGTLSEEDDILYTEGGEAVVDDATTLLFIHQSEQQLQILKRWD